VISLGPILRGEARDTVVFTGSNLLNRVGGLLLLPLYWSKLSPEDYGILAVIAVIGAFQALLSSLSLDLAVTRLYYEWPAAERRQNLGAIWVWNWLATLASGALFLLLLKIVGPMLFPEVPYDPWLLLGIIGGTLGNLFVIPASTVRIKRLPWLFAAYNLTGFALSTGLALWFVLVLDQGLRGLLISTILANLLLAAMGGLLMLRFARPALSAPGFRDAIRFALPAMPAGLIGTVGSILDRLVLTQFASLHTLGIYAVSLKFVDVLNGLHSSIKMSYGPFLMQQITEDRKHGREVVAAVTPYYLIPYLVVGLALSLFIGPVVHAIDRPDYFDVVVWVPLLAGEAVFACMNAYYGNGILLGKRTALLSIPAGAYLAVLTISSVALVPPYQLAGLVASLYLSTAAMFVISVYLSQKTYYIPHAWDALVGLCVLAVASAALGRVWTPSDLGAEVVVKGVLLLAFLGLAWWVVSRRGGMVRADPVSEA
jgi:O-antigen/teichoic acid export membrane protein